MADIEKAGGGADVQVLLDDARRVLERHLIAREGHEPRAKLAMKRVQRRRAKRCLRLGMIIIGCSFAHGRIRDYQAHRFFAAFAPSVTGPERFHPAYRVYPFGESPAFGGCFPECCLRAVLLPESFRGGCSFGASMAGLSRLHRSAFLKSPAPRALSTSAGVIIS